HDRKASTCSYAVSEPTVTIADIPSPNNLPIFRRGALCGVATDDRCASTSSSDDATFRLNIGGKSYRFRPDVILECRHESLLSMLIRADHSKRLMFTDGFRSETGEYYLERNIRVAEHIADYYITGKLHRPHDICAERFKEELHFWRLGSLE
ncbi:Protein C32C4.1 g, partial [Aphelenchoides avenae]